MGSAISIANETIIKQEVIRQKQLPLDCSDITDLNKAKEEILRIRRICHTMIPSDNNNSNNNNFKKYENISNNNFNNNNNNTSSSSSSIITTQNLSTNDQLTLALIHEVKNKITERFENLQDAFLAIDTDRDGFISRQEFKDACWRWGLPVDDEDFNQLNSLYPHQEKDLVLDRGINYLEFVALISTVLNYHAGSGELQPDSLHKIFCDKVLANGAPMRESFKRLDLDGSGFLDKNEIRRVFRTYKVNYTEAEFDELYQQYDTNKDGLFCYSEFVKMLQSSQIPNKR